MVPDAEPAGDQASGTARLARVTDMFKDHPELPWMLASAAVIRAHKIVMRRVSSVLKDIDDLSMPRYEILGLLDRAEGGRLAVRDLKNESFLLPPSLTFILDWLEERRLVKRSGSKTDRRSVVITITPAGRRLFQRATRALSPIRFGLEGLDEETASEVAEVLSRVRGQSSD
ncbi:MarR family winged helix-turn-helix transcriptional regulator [Mycobacterium kyogaense]|uniref:MarR family winged helix-turn-helix transcriptional regulator n=1 Tax=Mycobacterium kyogaense TaxID=2212479 RepID=UPI000DAE7E82|nr:MarR family transcriptional regulator [Mycobacterium kyogaense]